MKHLKFTLLTVLIISCAKEDSIVAIHGTKLISIAYTQNNRYWQEKYNYDEYGVLKSFEDLDSTGRRYEFEYDSNLIREIKTFNIIGNTLIFRDSILRDSEGRILTINKYSKKLEEVPLTWIYEFQYDSEGKLSKRLTYFKVIEAYTNIDQYYWDGNNVEKVEKYDGNGVLNSEFFYAYDDQLNYKKEIPSYITDPVNWSESNMLQESFNDYTGLIDAICNPCSVTNKYNLDGFPVEITYEWGQKLSLSYE